MRFIKSLPKITTVRLETNTGSSGGFARGIVEGLSLNADWLWLMDDDAIPRADALERLLAHADIAPDAGILSSAVIEFGRAALMHHRFFNPKTLSEPVVPRRLYKKDAVKIDTASFVGFLLKAQAARQAGLPNADFFIAYDDVEYSLRLKRHGWSAWLIPASIMNHKRLMESRLSHMPYGLKHYYNLRNRLAVYRHFGEAPHWRYLLPIIQHVWFALLTMKWSSLRFWRSAIRDSAGLKLAD